MIIINLNFIPPKALVPDVIALSSTSRCLGLSSILKVQEEMKWCTGDAFRLDLVPVQLQVQYAD